MTLEEFLERLKKDFAKEKIHDFDKNFMDLKKEKMTITEYNAKFRKLLSLARRLAPNGVTKVDQYVNGLSCCF